jgi:tetratricopeptide (TPR) repeat protein
MYYLYRAVAHACQAGLYKPAFISVYYDRIQRGQEFFAPSKLGTVGADIAALSCFFDVPWEHPVAKLTGRYRALLLGQAGYRLWMLGRLEEAIPPMKLALEADVARAKEALDDKKALKAWKYASVDANTLTSIYLSLGDLTQALTHSEDDVRYALNSGDRDQIVSALSTRGDVLHHQGDLLGSQEIFERAERIKGEGKQSPSFPHSLGHRRHDLLLSQGKYGEVQDMVRRILEVPRSEAFDLIDSALLYLSLGQANLFQAAHKYSEAKANLDLAMDYLLRAGRVVHIPRGRLALADLHLMTGEFGEAKFNLDEALSTATRNHTELHQADCYLKYAWLYLEQGENEKAQESWSKAKEIIDRRGYHLRDVDSHLLSARLYIAQGEKEKAQQSWSKAKQVIVWMGYHRRNKDIKDMEGQFEEVVTVSDLKPPLKDRYSIVELTINRDFDSFSADDQKQILDKIKDLLNLSTDIQLVSKERGSVILKIEITSEQAKQLLRLYEDGVLIELNVEYARVIDGSVNENKAPINIYDVFMCHNSEDKPEVKRIALRLLKHGIRPWLDEWELRPGLSWQQALEAQIENIKSAAVFLGKSGIGPWQDLELNAFIRRFVTRQCPVIPVILRSCTEEPMVPIFLEGMTWVNFKKRRPDPYGQLEWGITGEKK